MGKGRPRDRSTPELLPRLVEQIGFEPMTDNPMSSAHQDKGGRKATVELPDVLTLHHRRMRNGAELNRHCRVPRTHNLRPAKDRRIRDELDIDVLYH